MKPEPERLIATVPVVPIAFAVIILLSMIRRTGGPDRPLSIRK